jgi:3-oxoacyl-[acyl-carrier-protein] synthase-1
VVGTIKDFTTDSTDPEDWTYPAAYRIKRELLRTMAPNGFFAHCAMLQAVADAKLTEPKFPNPHTGLYAASAGSPYLLHYHNDRLLKLGVMRCSPLGIVASIAGTLNFNLIAAFKIQGSSCGFSSACASSAHALGFALDDLTLGRQQRMFVVGAEDGNRTRSCRLPACARCRCRPIPTSLRVRSTPRATASSARAAGSRSCLKPRKKSCGAA